MVCVKLLVKVLLFTRVEKKSDWRMFSWPVITILVLLAVMFDYISLMFCFMVAAGAMTGAIAGALAAKATRSGLLRGVSLGAIAGSILSVEVLEASRAYWCMEQTGSRGASSMVGSHFIVDFPWSK